MRFVSLQLNSLIDERRAIYDAAFKAAVAVRDEKARLREDVENLVRAEIGDAYDVDPRVRDARDAYNEAQRKVESIYGNMRVGAFFLDTLNSLECVSYDGRPMTWRADVEPLMFKGQLLPRQVQTLRDMLKRGTFVPPDAKWLRAHHCAKTDTATDLAKWHASIAESLEWLKTILDTALQRNEPLTVNGLD